MIDILNRNLSFFRLLRNNKRTIESFDIDSQFSSVIDYLNDVIVPAVNDMQAGALPGVNGSINYFITNVGDGSVTFNSLNNVIVDSTIATTKLQKATLNGKVLVSNNVGRLDLASGPLYANMVLTYRNGDVPEYRFINTVNIEDRSITYADIADKAIIKEHLHQEILNVIDAAVPNETITENIVITGDQFENLSINKDKFIPNTIATEKKLGYINNTLPNLPNGLITDPRIVLRRHIKDGAITPNKIKPYTIGALHFNTVKCLTKNKLATGVIDDSFLSLKQGETYSLRDIKNQNRFWFSTRMLSQDFRLQRRHLYKVTNFTDASLWPECFEDSVKNAFKAKGCY